MIFYKQIILLDKIKTLISKIKDQTALGTSNIIAAAINGFFWFVIASFVEKIEYGEIGYLISIATVGAAFANIGFNNLIIVYGAKNEKVFSPTYTLGLITSISAAIIAFVLTENIVVGLLIWGMMIFSLMMSELNSRKKYVTYSKLTIIRRTIAVVFALGLYPILGLEGIILGYFLATLPGILGLYKYIKTEKIGISVLKPKSRFMLEQYSTSLIGVLFWWGDKIIIGTLFGFQVLGSYQLAGQYLFFLNAIPMALMVYLLPQESQGIRNRKMKKYSVLLSLVIVSLSIVIMPILVQTIFPMYEESIIPIQIMSIGIIPITISVIFESFFLGREQTQLVLIAISLQTGLYFLLIITLGNQLGLIGIAISFLISTIVRSIFSASISRIRFKSWA